MLTWLFVAESLCARRRRVSLKPVFYGVVAVLAWTFVVVHAGLQCTTSSVLARVGCGCVGVDAQLLLAPSTSASVQYFVTTAS